MQVIDGSILEQWTALSDEEIVTRVLDGQIALFEILMRRHNERLYRAARAILRDDDDAEDVMQQAYVNAYTHLRQFDGRARFATWLTRIAVNEAIGRARRHGRYDTLDESGGTTLMTTPPSDSPERQAYARELRGVLEAAIDTLPDGAREVFVLREVQGLSTADTAASLGVSDDVVKTRLSRAKVALQRELLERVGAAASDAFIFHQTRCDRIVAAVFARIA
jgi:RNA polymerase sigma-70 factor (ECF subfamily)